MTPNFPRTMIIVWRWEELNPQNSFDEVNVVKSPNDKIIRIVNDDEDLLIEQTNKALKSGHTFVFLHRNHGFNKDYISTLIGKLDTDKNRPHLLKCFIFGDGLDYLYFDTQDEGLLDHDGYFMYEPEYEIEVENENGELKKEYVFVKVTEKNQQTGKDEIKLEHFDRVWDYYKGEFKKKINELMVDIVSAFVDLKNPKNNIVKKTSVEWCKALGKTDNDKEQYLNIRIKSFIEEATKDEIKTLNFFEKEQGFSFIFDDCKANFLNHENTNVRKFYQQLLKRLASIYGKKEDEKFSLNDLRALFLKLLNELN